MVSLKQFERKPMGRYDGEDYPPEHYLEKERDRLAEQLAATRALVRERSPIQERAFWVMATLGVGTSGSFSRSDATSALCKLGGLSIAEAQTAIDRWLARELLWDWTDQTNPIRVHGVEVHHMEEMDTEELVRQYGEPAREAQVKAQARERFYHISSTGRTLARAVWPEGRSTSQTTLHYSYGSG